MLLCRTAQFFRSIEFGLLSGAAGTRRRLHCRGRRTGSTLVEDPFMLKRRVALELFTAFLGATATLLHAPAHGQPPPSVPAQSANANPEPTAPADASAATSS